MDAVKYKYLFDPLFLISTLIFILNKLSNLLGLRINSDFISFYLNDILLVPVLLPPLLFISSSFKFPEASIPPKFIEIVIPVFIWSLSFEFIGPFLLEKGTADFNDVLAYSFGGFISWFIWNKKNLTKIKSYESIVRLFIKTT